jgi:hypothetical protein
MEHNGMLRYRVAYFQAKYWSSPTHINVWRTTSAYRRCRSEKCQAPEAEQAQLADRRVCTWLLDGRLPHTSEPNPKYDHPVFKLSRLQQTVSPSKKWVHYVEWGETEPECVSFDDLINPVKQQALDAL